VTMPTFGTTLRPFRDVPFVNTGRLGCTSASIRWDLGNFLIQTLLQRIDSIGIVSAGDVAGLLGVVAFFTLKAIG
jgi:hypothetical protein